MTTNSTTTTTTISKFTNTKLGQSNYALWAWEFRFAAMAADVWSIIDGSSLKPERREAVPVTDSTPSIPAVTQQEVDCWMRREATVINQLAKCVDDDMKAKIFTKNTAKEMWDCLENYHLGKTRREKYRKKQEIHNLNFSEYKKLASFIDAILLKADELKQMGSPMDDDDIIIAILDKLPSEYAHAASYIRNQHGSDAKTLDQIVQYLTDEASVIECTQKSTPKLSRTSRRDPLTDYPATAFTSYHNRRPLQQRPAPVCFKCKREGHIMRNCRSRTNNGNHSVFHTAFTASHETGREPLVWYIDSGATAHMTQPSRHYRLRRNDCAESVAITVGNGQRMFATSVTDIDLSNSMTLKNVFLVPHVSANLISVAQALDNGIDEISFTKHGVKMIRNGTVVATGSRSGNLFKLDIHHESSHYSTTAVVPHGDIATWHRRLGHISYRSIRNLHNSGVIKVTGSDPTAPCRACAIGKMSRLAFSSARPTVRTTHVGEVIHSDVCGPFSNPGLHGQKYYVTFIDEFSRHISVFIIAQKSDVFDRFKDYFHLLQTETGLDRPIQRLHSDNGGEYRNNAMSSFCRRFGIAHTTTTPHTPQQNGIAERYNRTLVETSRCMITNMDLPASWWTYAVTYAAYIRNRVPSSTLNNRSPYEIRFNKKPDMNHLRTFGSKAYVWIPDALRKKMDPKSQECRFLGISSDQSGYVLMLNTGRTIVSCHVKNFNEQDDSSQVEEDTSSITHFVTRTDESSKKPDRISLEVDVLNEEENTESETEDEISTEDGKDNNSGHATQPIHNQGSKSTITRSGRQVKPTQFYHNQYLYHVTEIEERTPSTYQQAIGSEESDEWIEAMKKEINSMKENMTWDLVPAPKGVNIVGSKWTYKIKTNSDGGPALYKARLVAQGFSQKYGVDYLETFSPVISMPGLRIFFAFCATYGLRIHHMDVVTAFLNSDLDTDIYMRQPLGFRKFDTDGTELVCKLRKAIYGLKQAGRQWWKTIMAFLINQDFKPLDDEPCLLIRQSAEELILLALYVDDLAVATLKEDRLDKFKKTLASRFKMKDLGQIEHVLGIKVRQDINNNIFISQESYTRSILQKYGMMACNPASTPGEVGHVRDDAVTHNFPYRECVGSLMYLAVATRPDISNSVSFCARKVAAPSDSDVVAIKRILRYLRGSLELGIMFTPQSLPQQLKLQCFVDADWAGDTESRKSTSGNIIMLNGPISWSSRKQQTVALSSTEAEYIALAELCQELLWVRRLLISLGIDIGIIHVHVDNQSAIAMAENESSSRRTKHIDVKFHFIKNLIQGKFVQLNYTPSAENTADIFTKALSKDVYLRHRNSIMSAFKIEEDVVTPRGDPTADAPGYVTSRCLLTGNTTCDQLETDL